jgi:hypothetical protein
VLPPAFSSCDAGEAAGTLLTEIRLVLDRDDVSGR